MPREQTPTILFLPGAWHLASCWHGVCAILNDAGMQTSTLDLPLNNPKELSDNAFRRDVLAVQGKLRQLVDVEGRDVIMVMHSYSGCCGTEALKDIGYRKEDRVKAGKEGSIVGVVYCAAFMLLADQTDLDYLLEINKGSNTEVKTEIGLSYCTIRRRHSTRIWTTTWLRRLCARLSPVMRMISRRTW